MPSNAPLLIRAHNDVEAIQCWLREYQHKATTYRSYRKEAERFLLWIQITLQKTLAQLTREDMEHYMQFLLDPQPRALWCGAGLRGGRQNKRGEGRSDGHFKKA